jgi:hypothetical protein
VISVEEFRTSVNEGDNGFSSVWLQFGTMRAKQEPRAISLPHWREAVTSAATALDAPLKCLSRRGWNPRRASPASPSGGHPSTR